jgi:protein-disulfide isomerase
MRGGDSVPDLPDVSSHGVAAAEPARWKRTLDGVASASMILAACLVMTLSWLGYRRQSPNAGHAPPPLPTAPLSLAGAVLRGDPTAPAVLIVFSDFQCPYCRAFAQQTFPKILKEYVAPGKLLVAFRFFPLSIHPFADPAARAALCAGEQNRFWEMHDQLFQSPQLNDSVLIESASAVGLDLKALEACEAKPQTEEAVREDVRLASDLKAGATPTSFVGRRAASGVTVLSRILGAQPYVIFQEAIEKAIRGGPAK